jgi:hypothetical protein
MRQPSPTGSVTTSSPGDYTRQAGKVTPIMAAVLAVTGVFVLFAGFAIAVVTVATVTGAGGVPPTTSSTPSAPVTTIDTAPTTTTITAPTSTTTTVATAQYGHGGFDGGVEMFLLLYCGEVGWCDPYDSASSESAREFAAATYEMLAEFDRWVYSCADFEVVLAMGEEAFADDVDGFYAAVAAALHAWPEFGRLVDLMMACDGGAA